MTDPQDKDAPTPRRWPWVLGSFALFVGIILFLWDVEDTADVSRKKSPPIAPPVTIVTVDRAETRASVSAFSELLPRWDAEIRSAISGRIIAVHDDALAGSRVSRGDVLISIQRTHYETAVVAAEVNVEQARLSLLRAQNQTTVLRRQFDRDGAEPPNELALYLPQLRIAERGLASAQAHLTAARRQLEDTQVVAPFSGFVTQRLVSLGQTVSEGEALLHLSDDDRFELVVELSQTEWALLDHPIAGGTAELFSRAGVRLGQADIRHGGGFLDPATRQVRVFLEFSDQGYPLMTGDFVRVTFEGRQLTNTLTLPETALTRAGHVWFVDADDLLVRTTPNILFRADDTITIKAPADHGPWRVARAPLASFLPGQKITPTEPAE